MIGVHPYKHMSNTNSLVWVWIRYNLTHRMSDPQATLLLLPQFFLFLCLVRGIHTRGLFKVICRALAVLILFLLAQWSRYLY